MYVRMSVHVCACVCMWELVYVCVLTEGREATDPLHVVILQDSVESGEGHHGNRS